MTFKTVSYFEINTFSILMLSLILHRHSVTHTKNSYFRAFKRVIVTAIINISFDFMCGLLENRVFKVNGIFSVIVNIGFFFSAYLLSYFTFIFTQERLSFKWICKKWNIVLSLIPLFIVAVLTILSLKFEFFFHIDNAGNYIKGPLYALMPILGYSYTLAIFIQSRILMKNELYYDKLDMLKLHATVVIIPIVTGVLQSMFVGISIMSLGITFGLTHIFLNMQSDFITLDPHTKLNNKARLISYLKAKLNVRSKYNTTKIYFIMMDIDYFKQINDKYGHMEGDKAITELAEILKRVCVGKNAMVARFGGDEFAIVFDTTKESELHDFIVEINTAIQNRNNNKDTLYNINVSIGYALCTVDVGGVSEFIDRADVELYKNKMAKRK